MAKFNVDERVRYHMSLGGVDYLVPCVVKLEYWVPGISEYSYDIQIEPGAESMFPSGTFHATTTWHVILEKDLTAFGDGNSLTPYFHTGDRVKLIHDKGMNAIVGSEAIVQGYKFRPIPHSPYLEVCWDHSNMTVRNPVLNACGQNDGGYYDYIFERVGTAGPILTCPPNPGYVVNTVTGSVQVVCGTTGSIGTAPQLDSDKIKRDAMLQRRSGSAFGNKHKSVWDLAEEQQKSKNK